MQNNKPYTTPVTDIFMLCPKERMMWELDGTGTKENPQTPAPVRLPEDN